MLTDICSYAVKEALAQNASEAEAFASFDKEAEVFLENSDLKQVKSHRKVGIGIRVFFHNSLGFASVNSLEKEKVSDAVSKAIRMAKVSPSDKNNTLPEDNKVKMLRGIYDKDAENFEPADATRYAIELLNAARSYDPRVSVDSGTFNSSLVTDGICNSNNIELEETASIFSWSVMGMAIDGSDVSNFDSQFNGTHFVKDIDVTSTATEFAKSVIGSLNARKIGSLKGTMLLSPNAVYELVEEVITFAINSHNVQKGTSKLIGMLGESVASSELTMIDDATFVEGLGAASFDREGVAHRKNIIISKGILKKYLYNTYTAIKDKTESTGNAVGSTISPPSVGATNIIMESGRYSLESMISQIQKGVIVNRYSGNINPVTGDFSGVVKGGHLIENGEVVSAVKEVMLAGNLFDSLKGILAVSQERRKIFDSYLPYIAMESISFTGG